MIRATPEEITLRNQLRGMLFLVAGQYQELNVNGKVPCCEPNPTNKPIWHRGSEYRQDLGEDEEYFCHDCGAVWLSPIPKPLTK